MAIVKDAEKSSLEKEPSCSQIRSHATLPSQSINALQKEMMIKRRNKVVVVIREKEKRKRRKRGELSFGGTEAE